MRRLFLWGFLVLAMIFMPGMAGAYELGLTHWQSLDPNYSVGKWGSAGMPSGANVTWELGYYEASGTPWLEDIMPSLAYETIIGDAFQEWEDATNGALSFTRVAGDHVQFDQDPSDDSGTQMGDIRIGYFDIDDGTGDILASSVAPPMTTSTYFGTNTGYGDIWYDADNDWESTWHFSDGTSLSAEDALYLITLHEIGHSIGLWHEEDVPSIMASSLVDYKSFTGLQTDDINGVRALYGPSNGGGDVAPVPEPTTIVLMGIGLMGMGVCSRRKMRRR
jgi:hypothetical protein